MGGADGLGHPAGDGQRRRGGRGCRGASHHGAAWALVTGPSESPTRRHPPRFAATPRRRALPRQPPRPRLADDDGWPHSWPSEPAPALGLAVGRAGPCAALAWPRGNAGEKDRPDLADGGGGLPAAMLGF
jgi:hypothetical protein